MVEIRIVDILAYSTEDPKYPARDLMLGKKWLTAKNFRGSMNEVTLKLEKCTVISAVDIGNCGTAIVTVEVSRTGLKDFYTLIPAYNLMTRQESVQDKNRTGVKLFMKEDMCEDIRDDLWDCVRVTCTQPFKFDPFGLSFIHIFSYEESPLVEPSSPTPQRIDAFIRRFNTTPKNASLSRSERLLLEATSGSASSSLQQRTSEAKEMIERATHDKQNGHGSKSYSGGSRVKQSLFGRPNTLSTEVVLETSKETKQKIKSNPSHEILPGTSRKKQEKQGCGERLSNWLLHSSVKDSCHANSSGPSMSHVKPNSLLHLPTKEEKPISGTVKDSEDYDSDSTVLNIPSSPESDSSQKTLNVVRSSSEEREMLLEDSTSEKTFSQRGRVKNCEKSSEKSVFVEEVVDAAGGISRIPGSCKSLVENREKHPRKSDSVIGSGDIEDVTPKRPHYQVKSRELEEPKIMRKAATKSVHRPKKEAIEISDNESNNSDDTVIVVEPSPEKEFKRRRISPPRMKKKSNIVWLCSKGEDSERKPSTTKKPYPVTCPLCSKDFPVSDIEAHAAQCEPIPEETGDKEGGGRKAKCPVCQKFVPQEVLEQHVNACLDAL